MAEMMVLAWVVWLRECLFHHSLLYIITQCSFPGGLVVKNLPVKQEIRVQSLDRKNSLKREMATQSSILAWEIVWTGEPGGLQSTGSQRFRHNLATKQQHNPTQESVHITCASSTHTQGYTALEDLYTGVRSRAQLRILPSTMNRGMHTHTHTRRAKIKANHHLNIVTLSSQRSPFKNGSKGRRWQFYL